MSHIPLFLRKLVIKRANNRCEYCQLSQNGQEATFHVDHIIPQTSSGDTVSENLALACVSCSLRKGYKEFAIIDGEKIKLFNPRKDIWDSHFEWRGPLLIGKTVTGNGLIQLLDLNRRHILEIREEEMFRNRHAH